MTKTTIRGLALAALLASGTLLGLAATARAQSAPPYGPPISLAAAKKAAAAALAAVTQNKFVPYVIAIVDPAGRLVYFERMDNAQYGSIRIALDKARSAALFRRPTKVFEDILAKGRTAILALSGAVPLEGGVPLVADGKIVGAIGASAGTGPQDGIVAAAGAAAIK
jgi:glc operon protein GlcG